MGVNSSVIRQCLCHCHVCNGISSMESLWWDACGGLFVVDQHCLGTLQSLMHHVDGCAGYNKLQLKLAW
jgi:hypothetical protein